jgi:hypothetical protein
MVAERIMMMKIATVGSPMKSIDAINANGK